MNRKIIAILAILIVAVSVGAVTAFSFGDSSDSDGEKINVHGVDFNIPDGFKEDSRAKLDGVENETAGVSYKTWTRGYENDDGDVIIVGVAVYDGYDVTDDVLESLSGGEELSVNGVDGYIFDDYPFYRFMYPADGDAAIVTVTDQDLLKDVIIDQ